MSTKSGLPCIKSNHPSIRVTRLLTEEISKLNDNIKSPTRNLLIRSPKKRLHQKLLMKSEVTKKCKPLTDISLKRKRFCFSFDERLKSGTKPPIASLTNSILDDDSENPTQKAPLEFVETSQNFHFHSFEYRPRVQSYSNRKDKLPSILNSKHLLASVARDKNEQVRRRLEKEPKTIDEAISRCSALNEFKANIFLIKDELKLELESAFLRELERKDIDKQRNAFLQKKGWHS